MRGSSLAWPASLDRLHPFIVTYWSGRTAEDAPAEVADVLDAAKLRHRHINLALIALDADGKVMRSVIPNVRPPQFRFDPDAQGQDFRRQLDDMLQGLDLPHRSAARANKLTLPDVAGASQPAGVRIYLTFGENKLNHYRTPTVEAVPFNETMRAALRYPKQSRSLNADDLRPILEQCYPPAIMDGHGKCKAIDAQLTLKPTDARTALLTGKVAIELDNNRTKYEGTIAIVITYAANDPAPLTLRGIGEWNFPKHRPPGQGDEIIRMTAAFESLPE